MDTLGVLVRTLACFFLVFATWNPSGYNFVWWATHDPGATASEIAAAGAALFGLYVFFGRIAWLSLGPDGITASLGILFAGYLTLYEFNIIDLWQRETFIYVILATVSFVLAIGMVWSLLKRRISGQSNYLSYPP
jgi:hypothetical protein